MNKTLKTYLIIVASIVVGGAAFSYGAMTAPKKNQPPTQVITQKTESPEPSKSPTPKKLSPEEKMQIELPKIEKILVEKYPKIATDYTINKGQLFEDGKWFGTTLTYKGTDIDNRDTLRVLMEKKDGDWILRTTPPQPILSVKEFPDVPKSILQIINKPISLPAGAANSPAINPAV